MYFLDYDCVVLENGQRYIKEFTLIEISAARIWVLLNDVLGPPYYDIMREKDVYGYWSQIPDLNFSYGTTCFFRSLKDIAETVPIEDILYCRDEEMVPILSNIFDRTVAVVDGIPPYNSIATCHLDQVISYANMLRQYVDDDDEFIPFEERGQ